MHGLFDFGDDDAQNALQSLMIIEKAAQPFGKADDTLSQRHGR
jgi:hypothetical protein